MSTQRWIWLVVGLSSLGIVLLIVFLQLIGSVAIPHRVKPVFFAPPTTAQTIQHAEAQKRLKRFPNDKKALRMLQDYHASRAEWDKSLLYARRLIALGTRDVNAYLGYIFALVNLGRLEEAKRFTKTAIDSSTDVVLVANLWRVLGDIYLLEYETTGQRSLLTQAKNAYTECSKALRDVPMCGLGFARVALFEGDLVKARETLYQIASNSSYPRKRALAKYYLSQIARQQGMHSEAIDLLNEALKEHPESFTVYKRK